MNIAWALLCLPGLWQLSLLAYAIGGRFLYPYDLEWMEGGMLVHAERIASGDGIYTEPSVDFIPYLYTPLYPALIAGLGGVFGISYQLGRAISILSLGAIVALACLAIWRDAASFRRGPTWCGMAAFAGLFAATYPWLEGWYDIVRADTLFVAMILGGLLLVRMWARAGHGLGGHLRVAVAGAILALAFFCKQTGVLYVATGGVLIACWNIRRLPAYVAASGIVGLGGTWLGNRITDGWLWTYIYQVHQSHEFSRERFYLSFWYILRHFPVMTAVIAVTLFAVLAAAIRFRQLPRSSAGFLTWTAVFAVSCLVGALGWGTQWAHFNAYMPAMTMGALACGSALCALATVAAQFSQGNRPWLPARAAAMACAVAIAGQLALARWSPARLIPGQASRAAGDALIGLLEELRSAGDVFVPYHPWYARLAGQQNAYVHRMGILDVTYRKAFTVAGLGNALAGARFAAVVLDNRPLRGEFPGLERGYRLDDHLAPGAAPPTVTGAIVHPHTVWLPVEKGPPAGAKALLDFESGSFSGLIVEGEAWGRRPVSRPLPGQPPVLKTRGRYFATSAHGGDRGTGTLISPEFTVDGERITFRMAGGQGEKLAVELRVDGQPVRRTKNPQRSQRMRQFHWDVSDLSGHTATIVVFDRDPEPGGHLSVDQFLLWQK